MASAAAQNMLNSFDALPENEKKEVATQIVVRAIGDPSRRATDNIWYIVVLTFAILVIGGLIAVFVLLLDGKSTDVITPLVTLGVGVLGGLLAPSPTKG
jgi:hypothetical protein